jgi:hypothetical protein
VSYPNISIEDLKRTLRENIEFLYQKKVVETILPPSVIFSRFFLTYQLFLNQFRGFYKSRFSLMCGTRLAVALSGLGGVPLSPSCRHKSHPGPKPRCPSAARLLAGKSSPLPRFPRRRPPLTFPPPRAGPDRRRTEPVTAVPT